MNVPALARQSVGEMTMPQAVALLEKRMIGEAMRRTRSNYSRAAHALGVTRRQLKYKIDGYGLAFTDSEIEEPVLIEPVRQVPRFPRTHYLQTKIQVSVTVENGEVTVEGQP